jgi:hypothetical protein
MGDWLPSWLMGDSLPDWLLFAYLGISVALALVPFIVGR